jgi:maltokinase
VSGEIATQLVHGEVDLLLGEELLAFATAQRWFGSKSKQPAGLRLLDQAVLRSEPPILLDALAEIRFHDGTHEVYQLLVALRESGGEPPESVIAEAGGWTSYAGFADPFAARELIHLIRGGTAVLAGSGRVEFHSLGAVLLEASALREIRPLGLEQSNSSVVIDDELIVKAYRRIEAGVNPELELLSFLTRKGFANVAELIGWWAYSGPLMSATLGIVQRYVGGAVDGWTLALRELVEAPEAFLGRLRRLGEVVGSMHSLLASDPNDQAFCPEQPSTEALGLRAATIDEEIASVFLHLPDDEALAPIVGRGDDLRDLVRALSHLGSLGRIIRQHGDLHLGQTLWADGDWMLVDFEGEPARPLPERRRKSSPLRDVAGMLRSFAYAVCAVELEQGATVPPGFEDRARSAFLEPYLATVQGAAILPDSDEGIRRLITLFELEKAVYELRYELNYRPDWVRVPVRGIARLLEGKAP